MCFIRGCRTGWYDWITTYYEKLTLYTFAIEIVGGIIYTIQLYPYIGQAALYTGIMQAISTPL